MIKQTHTPGPWSLLDARTLTNVKGPRGEQVCQLPIVDQANARLIAAAPDLLAALKEWDLFMRNNYRPEDISWWNQTAAAIAKAED